MIKLSYGDTITINNIKKSEIYYIKPSETRLFDNFYITVHFIDNNDWFKTLEFDTRKDWFNFVKRVNKLNAEFKKMKNIEK